MRGAALCVALLLVACGGSGGNRSQHRANDDAVATDDDDLPKTGDLGHPADLAKAKQTPCPCALGSYCDHQTNLCVPGCIGSDHCLPTDICDTKLFQCRTVCESVADCTGNRDCRPLGSTGFKVCEGCVYQFDDCNGDPADGCEAKLDSLTNCGKCGVAATAKCALDEDGDGFGVKGTEILQCHCPSGYANAWDFDCDDDDALVHPGQQMFQESNQHGGDFNCDGMAEPGYVFGTKCDAACDGVIWYGEVPGCGEQGHLAYCIPDFEDGCMLVSAADPIQACL